MSNSNSAPAHMPYRHLGKSGLQVSLLSFGSWVTFGRQMSIDPVKETIKYAFDKGVNFFDNAEIYSNGQSEELMGAAFKSLGIPRHHYILSTKFFWGIDGDLINFKNTLNRKYLMHAITGSLKRLQMDFVDIVYCHRPDPTTPIEETVMAMHDMIQKGYALYWGTSEWSRDQFYAAYEFSVKNGFHRPIVEQPQYNLLHRKKVENDFSDLYQNQGMGLTTWSPLASGLLTGKYENGIPDNSRLSMKSLSWLKDELHKPEVKNILKELKLISNKEKIPMSALAIGWCALNSNVSSVILGASSLDQLKENLNTLNYLNHIKDIKSDLDSLPHFKD